VTTPSRLTSIDPTGEFRADLPEYFFMMLFQVLRRQDAASEKLLKALGLTYANWRALLIIDRLQPCTMNDLARISTVERTTLTRTVDQLVAEGLAERSTPPEDRRQVRICLTPAGAKALDAGREAIYADQRSRLEGLDEQKLREATRLLHGVLGNLIDDSATAEAVMTLSRVNRADETD